MQQVALGQLGMKEQEFWDISPRSFFNAVEGYMKKRQEDLELLRLQTLFFVNVWTNKPIRGPRQLWKYSWEKKTVPDKDVKRLRERGKELAKRWQVIR